MNQPLLGIIIILVIALSLIIHGKIRADLIGLAALAAVGITGILEPAELIAGFSHPITIMLISLYIVGAGIFNSGLVEKITEPFFKWSAGSEWKLLLATMISAGVLSGLLSGTGIVAVLLPIVVSASLKQRLNPNRFLIPLAYASSLGGLLTLLGNPSNLIISDQLGKAGFEPLHFLSLTPLGIVALAAGLVFMLTAGKRFLNSRKVRRPSAGGGMAAEELAGMYKIYDRLFLLEVPKHSDIVGERLSDLNLPLSHSVTVIEIIRAAGEPDLPALSLPAKAGEVFHPDDTFLVFGEREAVDRLASDFELEMKNFKTVELKQHFTNSSFGVTEILIMPHSEYENQTLKDVHFREKYQCSVLAINRKGEYIQAEIGSEQLKPGDSLLVHGEWENIERISEDLQHVIVVGSGSEETEPVQEGKAGAAGAITVLMAGLLLFDLLPAPFPIMIPAILMVAFGCIRSMEEAYQRINWEPVVLLAVMFPLASALEKTGGVQLISGWLEQAGSFGPYGLLTFIYLLMMILSQFVSNSVLSVLLAPIVYTAAINLNYSPVPMLVCLAVAASMAFSTPAASPTNALVMTAGEYKVRDFALAGILLQLLIGLLMIVLIPLFFPF